MICIFFFGGDFMPIGLLMMEGREGREEGGGVVY